jgi:hypothetical protein
VLLDRVKRRRRFPAQKAATLILLEADDLGVLRLKESSPPDLWYNAAITELTLHLDSYG